MKKLSEILAAAGSSVDEIQSKLSGEVKEFMGEKLDKPITYTFDPLQFENVAEARQSSDWYSENTILKAMNQDAFTTAKSKAYQNATKDLKKAYESSDAFKKSNLIKAAVEAGFSQAEAEAMAASKLG